MRSSSRTILATRRLQRSIRVRVGGVRLDVDVDVDVDVNVNVTDERLLKS